MQHRIARFWARAVVWGAGCTLTVRGMENLRSQPVAVYASNHTSYMDTPVIFAALPFQFRILAKKELWPIAFIGWYLDRSVRFRLTPRIRMRRSQVWALGSRRCAPGCRLFVFPEGGRTETGDAEAIPLRSGLPGDSRTGAAGADCADWGLRFAADSHPALVPGRAVR